jgi:hypothetical protein
VFSGNIIEYFNFPVSSSKHSGIKQYFQEINCWLLKKVGIKHWSIKSVMIEKLDDGPSTLTENFVERLKTLKLVPFHFPSVHIHSHSRGKNGYKKNQFQCRYILHLVNSFTLERSSNSSGIYTFPRIYHM